MASKPNASHISTDPSQAAPPAAHGGPFAFLHNAIGFCLEWFIELLVRATGRSVRKTEAPWLGCFLGQPGLIGTGIYERIAAESGLRIRAPKDAGLIADFNALRGPSFDPHTVRPEIRDFYEHAAKYHLDVWTEVSLTGRFFLWLLVEFISRRMDQLNFPISSLEVAKGMSSEVVQLYDPNSGTVEATGWLRRLKSSGNVIYAGIYSVVQVPGEENPCVKVTFPCRGSANVYLRPVAHPDGSFGLDSSGSGFGRSGFYRIVDAGPDYWRVRNFTTLHELFHVYVDAEGVLRVDHTVSFVGLTIIRLHYKMIPLVEPGVRDFTLGSRTSTPQPV
ncbi:MAG TPA: hypothetical protein VIH74_02280 [Candidatus Acidoferrum sp.]|jgi:hypothetical protein